jgi:hypothetical protein
VIRIFFNPLPHLRAAAPIYKVIGVINIFRRERFEGRWGGGATERGRERERERERESKEGRAKKY